MRKTKTIVLCAAVMAGLAACSTGQPGVTNRLGTITATLPASTQDVTAAAAETLEDMGLILISHEATAIDGRAVARTAQDDPATIDIEKADGDQAGSDIGIHVGMFGNQAMSLTILGGIRERLE